MFLLGGPFEEYHIIYSFTLDEEAISKRFICKLNDEGVYHRIQDIHNVLDVFQFILLDQSFKPIIFASEKISPSNKRPAATTKTSIA